MTKKLTKTPVVKPDTEIINIDVEQVKNLVANHLEVVTTILDTYEDLLDVLDDGVKTELLASVDNLTEAIDSIPEAEYEFDKLVEKLEALKSSEIYPHYNDQVNNILF